ncbi:putative proteasome subunit beta type-6 [Schizosaccharomyces pombe]|uniref:Probable proteasome subunit beta type-6 n=1 Tax=Schizosaccharomyces pombe (strain 972 / ATCC 24843) TaxID=284812 RepID=PSB6_SCHPO|nr:20S proteasome component beta 6 [Schizosaccharomyces pombe]Q9UQY2.1 RecName: Full=Probable proteasome subunit beta type-6 [Schizosaccharomyces pombe 972h-]BAA88692.1 catalytic subunit (C5) of proteasome [Schizosaccharomyces pombe]CAB52716.1 20S proteasome component beta 6 [Schizosaccharomyces pombe]|eukprot:NP_594729.1 20S proteasome component beta 6 [Schizosaccharomyces pombe]
MSQSQFDPYVQNGGTTVAIAGDGFAILAGDTRSVNGYNINTRFQPRVHEVGDDLVIGASGFEADALALVKRIQQRIDLYHDNHERKMSAQSCACMVRTLLYGKRFFPYYVYTTVAGIDKEGKGEIYSFDPVGSYEREWCRAGGSAANFITPFLDNQVNLHNQYVPGSHGKERKPRRLLKLEEAMKITTDAFTSAGERHIEVGDSVLVKIITKEGVETRIIPLKKD